MMNAEREIKIFPTPKTLAAGFAEDFFKWLTGKEYVNIALSGGSTPKILFKLWADRYKNAIDWSKIHFYWGDERCVSPDHDDSNYKMTHDLLFKHIDIPEANIHRIKGEENPVGEAKRYENEILAHLPILNDLPVFDMIILGMGGDGHTASIFPHEIELLNSDKICEVATHPESGQKRITLTGKVINQAQKVFFLITGNSKTKVLTQILEKREGWKTYPTSYILPEGDLMFYVDERAMG